MSDYIDRCLDEGLLTPSEYFGLIEAGDDDFPTDPEICVREAGHAVAAYVLGRPIKSVSAYEWEADDEWESPDGSLWSIGSAYGRTQYLGEPLPKDDAGRAARLFRDMAVAMASGYAERLYAGAVPKNALGDDRTEVFDGWLRSYTRLTRQGQPPSEASGVRWEDQEDAVLGELWSEVERIILENWDFVCGLATVLMRGPWLDGPEVYEIFGRIEARRPSSN
jgi:hypothetical protein